ncbi:hypothetical protein BH18THE1_BH18THE1_21480 [soil metagenome]
MEPWLYSLYSKMIALMINPINHEKKIKISLVIAAISFVFLSQVAYTNVVSAKSLNDHSLYGNTNSFYNKTPEEPFIG